MLTNIKCNNSGFMLLCMLMVFFASPVLGETTITKDIKGQNVNITIVEAKEKPWWLDSTLQVITIATGFGIVIFQLGRQHKNAMNIEENNSKNKLHLEIFQRIAKHINTTQSSEKVRIDCITLPGKIWDFVARGAQSAIPERMEQFNIKFNTFTDEILNLIFLIEEFEIALYRFGIFRVVFSCQMDRIREAYMDFSVQLNKYLPIDLPGYISPVALQTPSEIDIRNLKISGDKLSESIMDMLSYIYDFRLEAQNQLLGDLFKRKIVARNPTDSKYVVITTDLADVDKIIDHFAVSPEDRQRWVDAIARDIT